MATPRLDKRLGQHHLRQGHLCRPLLDFLGAAGRVLEVGPGGGVLTAELLAAGHRVIGWEVDPSWAFELRRRLRHRRLALVVGDAMDVDWRRLAPGSLAAGNLPYAVATALLQRLLEPGSAVARAAFLVQLEVARRLVAGPGDAAYGSLSVLVAARAEARILGRVRPGSFRPPPRVESAFVGLEQRPPVLPDAEMASFTRLVRLAFARRRKTLRNALAAAWGRGETKRLLAAAGLDPAVRAEALPLAAFVELHRRRAERRR